jgi:hypothetical protein
VTLDRLNLLDDLVERARHKLVHRLRLGAADDPGRVAVTLEQRQQLCLGDPGQHSRIGDLVAVQMEDRQHDAVADRVQELVRVPARRQRPGLRLAVADHAADEQVRVVERRSVRMDDRVAELAALVDRAWGLGCDVAGDAARERELTEQTLHPVLVTSDMGIDLAVGPLEVRVRHDPRAAVSGTRDVDRVQVLTADHPVHVGVDEVEARRGAPVAEQPRLDLRELERLVQKRVVEQVDLADGQIVRRPPVRVEAGELVGVERIRTGPSG